MFFNLLNEAKTTFENFSFIAVIIIFFIGIILTLYLSVFKIREKNPQAALLVSVIVCCVLMIPVITSLNHFITSKIESPFIDQTNTEVRLQQERAARLMSDYNRRQRERERIEKNIELARNEIEKENLNRRTNLLDRAMMQMQGMQQISELALTNANFKQIMFRREYISDNRNSFLYNIRVIDEELSKGNIEDMLKKSINDENLVKEILFKEKTEDILENYINKEILYAKMEEVSLRVNTVNKPVNGKVNEILVVSTNDYNAKFGVDLKEIKIFKTDDVSVVVSGIHPKFIAAVDFKHDYKVREIRQVEFRNGMEYETNILNNKYYTLLAYDMARIFQNEFEQDLYNGSGLKFMDDTIIQLAQNFIRIILSQVFDNISYDNIDRPDALPLMDFLLNEIRENNEDVYRNLKMDEITLNINLLEKEVKDLEKK